MKVIKKEGKHIHAYQLGSESPVLAKLVAEGQIVKRQDGSYEVFSREAINGTGQIAKEGDFIKFDSEGYPYPNDAAFFIENHRQIEGDEYEQFPKPLEAWSLAEEETDVIRFLKEHKGLVICPEDPERYFTAPLWRTLESAASNAVIVFYRVERDENGSILDADFNFVARVEFEKSYCIEQAEMTK